VQTPPSTPQWCRENVTSCKNNQQECSCMVRT
jgi:hypothetical protein